MKNNLSALFIIAALGMSARAQSLVFSNQTITVLPSQLSVESVEYRAASVETNTVFQWLEMEQVTTNGMFDGYTVETNTVGQQVATDVVTTNAATWVCNVIFELPKGYQWTLNGMPVILERFKASLKVPVSPVVVSATFGPAAAGLEFAASNGAYAPQGQVRDAFLGFAAAALAGGAQ
ncbi:MAG: hypothetical protein PHP93_03420 [Kiritimatiellales bacterium]|nr:hypothetical protein [Kiritimatiellales bacterium]